VSFSPAHPGLLGLAGALHGVARFSCNWNRNEVAMITKQKQNRFRPQVEALEGRLVPDTYLWTGAHDSSWDNHLNWHPASGVPGPGDDVVIPYGLPELHYPIIGQAGPGTPDQENISVGSISAGPNEGGAKPSIRIWSNTNLTIGGGSESSNFDIDIINTSGHNLALAMIGGTFNLSSGDLSRFQKVL
jgi:hypothetical protein